MVIECAKQRHNTGNVKMSTIKHPRIRETRLAYDTDNHQHTSGPQFANFSPFWQLVLGCIDDNHTPNTRKSSVFPLFRWTQFQTTEKTQNLRCYVVFGTFFKHLWQFYESKKFLENFWIFLISYELFSETLRCWKSWRCSTTKRRLAAKSCKNRDGSFSLSTKETHTNFQIPLCKWVKNMTIMHAIHSSFRFPISSLQMRKNNDDHACNPFVFSISNFTSMNEKKNDCHAWIPFVLAYS